MAVFSKKLKSYRKIIAMDGGFPFIGWPWECAGKKPEDSIGEFFTGEVLRYHRAFWLIDPVGRRSGGFSKPGEWKVMFTMWGKGRGFVDGLPATGGIYRSTMSTTNNGKRLYFLIIWKEYS